MSFAFRYKLSCDRPSINYRAAKGEFAPPFFRKFTKLFVLASGGTGSRDWGARWRRRESRSGVHDGPNPQLSQSARVLGAVHESLGAVDRHSGAVAPFDERVELWNREISIELGAPRAADGPVAVEAAPIGCRGGGPRGHPGLVAVHDGAIHIRIERARFGAEALAS